MDKRYALRLLLVLVIVLWAVFGASAQRKLPTAEEMLDVNGALGTEFFIAIPPNEVNPYPVDDLEIYVASAFDTEIEVFDYAGNKFYKKRVQSYIVRTLSDRRGETNWTWEIREPEQNVKKAIRIRSKKPISVYVLNSKVFTADGYLAIPVSAWGRDYIPITYYDFREIRPWACGFVIISRENSTIVEINLKGTGELDARTSGGRRINTGQPFQITLDEGDCYLIKGDGQTRGGFDLTGTTIKSDKPIGVISYHERTTMPNLLVNGNGRNHLVEMTPPVSTWGKEYVTVEYSRENNNGQGKGDVFRVVARDEQTRWSLKYYDKKSKQLIGQGGGYLAKAGEFADLDQSGAPTNITSGFSVWTADKPVFVMQYSCSSSWDGDPNLDPFMINVTPADQFITSTIFQMPTNAKFLKHRLNLIVKTDTASPDYIKNLESLEIDDIPVWRHPAASAPTLKFTKMANGLHWATIDFGTEARAHRIKSNGKVFFGGYIYGFGAFDAYGWPAAAGFKPTTSFDTMPPLIKADSLCGDYFLETTELRNIPDPPTAPPKDSDQVETGIANIDTVEGFNSYNYQLFLITAQTEFLRDPSFKTFKYEWRVIDKGKDARVVYYVQDWANNITFDTCFYFADKLAFSPNLLNFGKLRLGTNATADITVTNNSSGPVSLTETKLKLGTYYTIVSGGLPPVAVIPGNGTHTITIRYDGRRETKDVRSDFDLDTLVLKTTCGEFKYSTTGVAAIPRITVEDYDAGTASLNQEICKLGGLKITNPGSDTLVITAISGWLGTNFTLSTPFTPALPIRIAPKASVDLKNICYKSSTVTVDDINVTFSNNGDGPDSISNWKGQTQSPGPIIVGYDWRQRRVGTLHQALGSVANTGNQLLKLIDVTFLDGSKYDPAGSTEANYVFKIVGLFDKGAPVATIDLRDRAMVDVMVMFRPNAEAAFVAEMKPVWEGTVDSRPAKLLGTGIIPKIDTDPISLTCFETPETIVATRTMTVTNPGTMPLTISDVRYAMGTSPAYAVVSTPTRPFVVAPLGGTAIVTLAFTRPIAELGIFDATVEFSHDATPGSGQDSSTLVPVGPHTEKFTVGSCSAPSIGTGDRDYARQRANCDTPILDFPIINTSNALKPLVVRDIDIVESGADAAFFTIVRYLDQTRTPTTLPLTIQAGQTYYVEVQFSPTEPNSAPWLDRIYNAQYDITGYGRGDALPAGTVTANVTGIGYVVPVTFNLSNDIKDGASKEPGNTVEYSVSGVSNNWVDADVTSFIVDMVYETQNLSYQNGSIQIGAGLTGVWTINNPTISVINATQSQMRFTATGGNRINNNAVNFTFKSTLLLAKDSTSRQDLVLTLPRPCQIPSTTGDSTAIFNCALNRRIVNIGATSPSLAPVSPNPINSGTARVEFGVGILSMTTLDLINSQGATVKTFVNNHLQSGKYDMVFSTHGLATGIYFLRMQTGAFSTTQKVMVVN